MAYGVTETEDRLERHQLSGFDGCSKRPSNAAAGERKPEA